MSTNIKKARTDAGFSQKLVAITLQVSAPTVSDWESGKIYPSAKNLIQLSKLYKVSIDYLLGVEGATHEPVNDITCQDVWNHSILQKLRIGCEYSAETVARQVGMTTADYLALENGTATPNIAVLHCLAAFFCVPSDYFLFNEMLPVGRDGKIHAGEPLKLSYHDYQFLEDYMCLNELGRAEARKNIGMLVRLEEYTEPYIKTQNHQSGGMAEGA